MGRSYNRGKASFYTSSQRRAVTVTSWSATPVKAESNQNAKYLAHAGASWRSSKQQASKRLLSPREHVCASCCSAFGPGNENTFGAS